MFKHAIAAATAVLTLSATALPASAQAQVQLGRLSCDVEGGVGMILGSQKDMVCDFFLENGGSETYTGTISKIGIDVGVTESTHIEWLVFAAADTEYATRALAGSYVGASGEATIGVGLGGNVLVGGSRDSFALQPFSVQSQTGLNFSVGLAGLTLR